jgi:hypothetical protein
MRAGPAFLVPQGEIVPATNCCTNRVSQSGNCRYRTPYRWHEGDFFTHADASHRLQSCAFPASNGFPHELHSTPVHALHLRGVVVRRADDFPVPLHLLGVAGRFGGHAAVGAFGGPEAPPICRRHRPHTAMSTAKPMKSAISPMNIPVMPEINPLSVPCGGVSLRGTAPHPAVGHLLPGTDRRHRGHKPGTSRTPDATCT